MPERPSAGQYKSNWDTFEGSTREKLSRALRNNLIKLRKRSGCCGNHGEPGC
jgi:hypothetical protein